MIHVNTYSFIKVFMWICCFLFAFCFFFLTFSENGTSALTKTCCQNYSYFSYILYLAGISRQKGVLFIQCKTWKLILWKMRLFRNWPKVKMYTCSYCKVSCCFSCLLIICNPKEKIKGKVLSFQSYKIKCSWKYTKNLLYKMNCNLNFFNGF